MGSNTKKLIINKSPFSNSSVFIHTLAIVKEIMLVRQSNLYKRKFGMIFASFKFELVTRVCTRTLFLMQFEDFTQNRFD